MPFKDDFVKLVDQRSCEFPVSTLLRGDSSLQVLVQLLDFVSFKLKCVSDVHVVYYRELEVIISIIKFISLD